MFEKASDKLEEITERTGRWAAWLALLLVVVTGIVVLLRYAFQTGSIALQESLIYINALLFTLGAAYTLKHDRHVRVDIFYSRMSTRNRALVDFCGTLFLLFPLCGFILWTSWDYVSFSWQIRERSVETSGLPFVYLLKSTILVLAGFLLWQGVAEACNAFRLIKNGTRS
ncbi:MAG: TRAP transporter small permease subunit [Gammaproteobacteria bacterium]|nr:TRAP transporter small permease subunit [Gammaproteobacteria bacterium]